MTLNVEPDQYSFRPFELDQWQDPDPHNININKVPVRKPSYEYGIVVNFSTGKYLKYKLYRYICRQVSTTYLI